MIIFKEAMGHIIRIKGEAPPKGLGTSKIVFTHTLGLPGNWTGEGVLQNELTVERDHWLAQNKANGRYKYQPYPRQDV